MCTHNGHSHFNQSRRCNSGSDDIVGCCRHSHAQNQRSNHGKEQSRQQKASCQIDQTQISLQYKSTFQLSAAVLPADAKDTSVSWSSSDEAVATVDQTGLVTAVEKGAATIICRSNDGFASSDCQVEVYMTRGQWIVRYVLFGWVWDK